MLVDRSKQAFRFPGSREMGTGVFPTCTILDGELVMNRSSSNPIFLIFDILFHDRQSMLHEPFSTRLAFIHQTILPCYRDKIGALPKNHLALVGKKFYKKKDIGIIFDRVREEHGNRFYTDTSCPMQYLDYLAGHPTTRPRQFSEEECRNMCCHKTDGIILQPEMPYACGTDLNLFKWKYQDTVTVDFYVSFEGGFKVSCGTQAGQGDVTKQIVLEAPDLRRMRADMDDARHNIVELGFNASTGFWSYKMVRTDKNQPNFFTTVFSTLEELAEGIEEEELQYRLMVNHPARDDWAKQNQAMRRKCIEWKKKKTS